MSFLNNLNMVEKPMIEKPINGRAKIDSEGAAFQICIPTQKNWFVILFLCAWLIGWYIGESSVLTDFLAGRADQGQIFTLVWLVFWTFAGVYALISLVWSLIGQEIFRIDNQYIQVGKGFGNMMVFSNRYDIRSIHDLMVNREDEPISLWNRWNSPNLGKLSGGTIQFNSGSKTVKFGIGISIREATYLIGEIKKREYRLQ